MAQPGAKPEQQKAAFENVKAPEGKGYYAALSLEFDCTVQGALRPPAAQTSPPPIPPVPSCPLRRERPSPPPHRLTQTSRRSTSG